MKGKKNLEALLIEMVYLIPPLGNIIRFYCNKNLKIYQSHDKCERKEEKGGNFRFCSENVSKILSPLIMVLNSLTYLQIVSMICVLIKNKT